MENNHINCENCGHEINIEKVLYVRIQKELVAENGKKNIADKKELEKNLRKSILEETSAEIQTYKEELSKKVNEVKEFNKLKAQLEISNREKETLRESI